MRDFTFEITPGNFITKEANTVDEALKLVKADLAIKASLPELDNILFDYESGVPNIKGIRTKLGRVEVGPKMIEEQDSVLENIVGSKIKIITPPNASAIPRIRLHLITSPKNITDNIVANGTPNWRTTATEEIN